MRLYKLLSIALALLLFISIGSVAQAQKSVKLSNAQMENLVRRSYQYVAMFNVNNKGALDDSNPMSTQGYNKVRSSTTQLDHRSRVIARPNNDTLYTVAMVDVTKEPIVMKIPAFDSTYVSLMVTGYDHYVNIPMSTSMGKDIFAKPSTILFYSERTPGYHGEPVAGVDKIFEATGDFLSAVLRVMPHAAEPKRLAANQAAMQAVTVEPLSEFLGRRAGASAWLWPCP